MPDGVYFRSPKAPVFIRIAPPTRAELQALVERIGANLGKHLERRGILVRDVESSYLALDPDCDEDALPDLQGHSISYRIALGSRRGQKAFTLQTLSPRGEERVRAAQANGFSLHAGVAAEACERSKLERLCPGRAVLLD
jgi:Putative transposase